MLGMGARASAFTFNSLRNTRIEEILTLKSNRTKGSQSNKFLRKIPYVEKVNVDVLVLLYDNLTKNRLFYTIEF
jgi:hypothetical protein